MTRLQAAEELIAAMDQARELGKVGRLTRQDMFRVQAAIAEYRKATR
jgi:hypothetical protein